MGNKVRIAIIQQAPVHLNLDESLNKAIDYIEYAAEKSAQLVVFGETWLTGYPSWIDSCPDVALWNNEATKEVYLKLYKSSITVPGEETKKLGKLAKEQGIVICMGVNEKVDEGPGNGTIYNGFIVINEMGELVIHRRKLMPTFSERLLYGHGDGYDLKAADTAAGRVGGLICWEHWMPLTRQAMHDSGEHIHVALWPTVHEMHQVCSRAYAFEGRCFVIAAGQMMKAKDIPEELWIPQPLADDPEKYILNGGSCVIGPDGKYVVEPVFDREEIITAEIDLDECVKERMTLDVSGHYARGDVFDFMVYGKRRT